MGDRPCFTLLQWIPAVGEGSGGGEEGKGGAGEREGGRGGGEGGTEEVSGLEADQIASTHIPLAQLSSWPQLTAREAGARSSADAQQGGAHGPHLCTAEHPPPMCIHS